MMKMLAQKVEEGSTDAPSMPPSCALSNLIVASSDMHTHMSHSFPPSSVLLFPR